MTESLVAEPIVAENYSFVSTVCFVCGITAPGLDPSGWATWTRTSTELPYYLHTCPEHSTHEGLWAEPPTDPNAIKSKPCPLNHYKLQVRGWKKCYECDYVIPPLYVTAEPPTDGDLISRAIDAAFEATYPDQIERRTILYHKLRNAIIEKLGAANPPTDPKATNYVSVSAICFVCRKTAPGMEPEGWATWERRIDAAFPLPYYLHTCHEHSTHEGLVAAIPYFSDTQRTILEWEGDIEEGTLSANGGHTIWHIWTFPYLHSPDDGFALRSAAHLGTHAPTLPEIQAIAQRLQDDLDSHLVQASEVSRLRAIIAAAKLECQNTLTSRLTNRHEYGDGLKEQATWVLSILNQA